MACTGPQTNPDVRALRRKVNFSCRVQRIRTNTQTIWLHQSVQPCVVRLSASFKKDVLYIFFNYKVSKVSECYFLTIRPQRYRNIALNLMTTNTRSPRLFQSPVPKITGRWFCLTIFDQYLIKHWVAALDEKRFLSSDIAQALPVLTDLHVSTLPRMLSVLQLLVLDLCELV